MLDAVRNLIRYKHLAMSNYGLIMLEETENNIIHHTGNTYKLKL